MVADNQPLHARSIKSEEITARTEGTIVRSPCKECLAICCRAKEVGRCTVPAYDSVTRQAWTRRPATTAGRGVLARVVCGQVQAPPHVHGIGGAGRDEHLSRQLGANC